MEKSKSVKSPVFHLVYSLWHLIQNISQIFHYFEILSFIDSKYLFCKTIFYIDISKENFANSTMLQCRLKPIQSVSRKTREYFYLRFPVKNKQTEPPLTSTVQSYFTPQGPVLRCEDRETRHCRTVGLQEGGNVNFLLYRGQGRITRQNV